MKRVALYVRVSTIEQKRHGLSVDSQIEALKEYCKKHNYTIVDLYNDAGFSARKSYKHRPGMQKMIEDCKAGKIDLILMTKLDRFFRSVKDYYAVIDQIGENIPWRTIWEDYETETSSGVFKVNLMLSLAQAESDRTSDRVKAINEYRRSQGKYVGQAPHGYKYSKEAGTLIKDPDTCEIIQEMFDNYANSMTKLGCVKIARAKGMSMALATFKNMLMNETYTGNALGVPCEAYITKEQYEINKRRATERAGRQSIDPDRIYFLSGVGVCPVCGSRMGGSIRKTKNSKGEIKIYKYYRCTNFCQGLCANSHTISETVFEKALVDNLDQQLETTINEYLAEGNERVNVSNKIELLKNKLTRVGDRYEDGDITRDEYKSKRAKILLEIDELKAISPVAPPKPMPENWKTMYFDLDEAHKKTFWATAVKKVICPTVKGGDFLIKF